MCDKFFGGEKGGKLCGVAKKGGMKIGRGQVGRFLVDFGSERKSPALKMPGKIANGHVGRPVRFRVFFRVGFGANCVFSVAGPEDSVRERPRVGDHQQRYVKTPVRFSLRKRVT